MICEETGSGTPIVVGKCPSCTIGDRTLILIDYVPNLLKPENGGLYFKCLCCLGITRKRIHEVVEN